jgi:serine/threonine-protein kinase Stk1
MINEPAMVAASDQTYFAYAQGARQPTIEPGECLPDALPDLLAGRYKIERLLGVGGMGAVYRARDLLREQFGDPDPHVALKTLSEEFAEYPDAHALLYSEFALTARLRHRHVVRLFDFEVDAASRRAFITLELLKGPTLDQLLLEHPDGLPLPLLESIALPLLEALQFSHQLGVLHGDIKPSNVILAEDGLRLFDFGLGQPLDSLLPGLPRLARHRFAAWTPRYAAPELLDGGELTASADVYAVACVLYELSAGQHPFRRLSAKQAKSVELDGLLKRPSQLPPRCWPALRQALAFDPAIRTASVGPLIDAFSAPAPSRLRRWLGRAHG